MLEAPSIPLHEGHHPHVRKLQEPFWLFKAKEKKKPPGLKQLVRNPRADKHLALLCQEKRI